MKHCAFLSMDDLTGYECDDHLAVPHLEALGWSVATHSWRASGVDWGCYDLVVIRSPWDYQNQLDDFLATLRGIENSGAVLANSLSTVEWNIHKTSLRDLAARGVPTVPTLWGRGGELTKPDELFDTFDTDEIVLKRVVGAGAQDAYRLKRPVLEDTWAEVLGTYADKDWMAQPFLSAVLDEGEISLFYFNGQLAHAIRKLPKAGDYRVQEEHGGQLTRIEPEPSLIAVADGVIAGLIGGLAETLLYARVDLVRGADGGYQLMELEVIEPALYFRMDEAAPGLFARALDQWWAARKA